MTKLNEFGNEIAPLVDTHKTFDSVSIETNRLCNRKPLLNIQPSINSLTNSRDVFFHFIAIFPIYSHWDLRNCNYSLDMACILLGVCEIKGGGGGVGVSQIISGIQIETK